MQALHFGAGNIGRGFIGYLLNKTGYNVCFVDVNEKIIESINKTNSYTIELLDDDQTRETIFPVTALNSIKEEEKVIQGIIEVDIITTSVGVGNLSKIAEILSKGLSKRLKENKTKIDVIANENAINASSTLKKEIEKHVPSEKMSEICEFVGFPNSAIDRLALSKETDQGEIALVEPVYEWVINKSEMMNLDLPLIEDVIYVENLDPYIKRKIYMVNMGHAATAYIGFAAGEDTIQSTLAKPEMEDFIRGVLDEVKHYVVKKLGFESKEIDSFIEKTLKRFKNENISDNVLRVGKDPMRKLGYDERLIKPLRELFDLGVSVEYLSTAVSAAFLFSNSDDEEAVRLEKYIQEQGINEAIYQFTEIEDPKLKDKIVEGYYELKDKGCKELIKQINAG
ncbi:mannitol-1-phosphate/altronate dehydrogenase [Halobacteroides halobius DSM 5150]|uniref:Mannitol-1-phosphate 5-dehydrogenase n=1 Tax=Halobacteroides halobius (strain ATCC 35273 / DSM 5150 / MD-1) TaxID=748449 RepID=L0KB06_HALHC|nr:mannitol-1-phosphate 5-dehydrogenase [Halobacteroides halobius]AGB42196.1 mannitol-1-phosphate/altronate dehydrogenase [Halobacteroides halobius DSM 5150]